LSKQDGRGEGEQQKTNAMKTSHSVELLWRNAGLFRSVTMMNDYTIVKRKAAAKSSPKWGAR
jgi:hypothetical protein